MSGASRDELPPQPRDVGFARVPDNGDRREGG